MAEEPSQPPTSRRHEVAEFALLGLLRDAPSHGYALAAEFAPEWRLGAILHLKMSQMYAYLHKLERQGWLVARDEPPEAGRPRRVFSLTDAGKRSFDAWLARPVSATRDVRLEFLVKLAFALERDRDLAARLVSSQREATGAWLARLEQEATPMTERVERLDARNVTRRHRILQSRATLTWLDELLARLA